MTYYEMSGMLPLHPSKHYAIHQMIEVIATQAGGEGVKGQYRYIVIPKGPGSCHYLLRSAVPLAGANVNEHSLTLDEGDTLTMHCSLSLLQSYYPDPASKKRKFFFHSEPEQIAERVTTMLTRVGLRPLSLTASAPKTMKISKPRHHFLLPYTICASSVLVTDPQRAVQAMVQGIGEKRAFGLGLPLFQREEA